jgi:hypothetical protein
MKLNIVPKERATMVSMEELAEQVKINWNIFFFWRPVLTNLISIENWKYNFYDKKELIVWM